MTREQRYAYILDHFQRTMPQVTSELNYGSVFQLLVAVILSAQCTDRRVNTVTPALFHAYPTAHHLAQAAEEDIKALIASVSYPNAKAVHLVQMAQMLVSDYDGEVPDSMDDLMRLPGVGRKTANVVQAVGYGRSAIAVDTHVFRVSRRLGLVPPTATTPLKVEQQLKRHIPSHLAADAHHWLLLHGRYICTSRKPHCDRCPFNAICPKLLEHSKLE